MSTGEKKSKKGSGLPSDRDASQKNLIQSVMKPEVGERLYSSDTDNRRGNRYAAMHDKEDSMIDAIDMRRNMEKLIPLLDKFGQGKLDVRGFLGGVEGHLLRELLLIAFSGDSEKNKLDALKHLLGIAGHSPTQKHEIGRLDPQTPKEALLAMIRGSKRDLEDEGIRVVEDDDTKPEGT